MEITSRPRLRSPILLVALAVLLLPAGVAWGQADATTGSTCARIIQADVVALDQPFFWNRLGAVEPQGMIFALKRDIVPIDATRGLVAGNVQLRSDKRPRPVILRMNVGDCMQVNFTNLLSPTVKDAEQPATRTASVHVMGMQLVGSIASDGSNVGKNVSSLVAPGGSAVYKFYAEREGGYLLYSTAATTGGEGDGGSLAAGLFGAVTVEPKGAEWYRSQVTADDLKYATKGTTADGHPIINYAAVFPAGHKYAGLPVLAMLQGGKIVYSDLTAMITGPNAGRFAAGTYPAVPEEPDRLQPFREFGLIYHDEFGAVQAFPEFEDPQLKFTLHGVRDAFAINYGTGGIGAEILANRFGVGPMKGCTECKYEEFFLTSWAVGDPAMVVDVPANSPCTPDQIKNHVPCLTTVGTKATKAFYPDDPSNVYHSYIKDHVKFRILHAGPKEHHIHHLHAHQWVHTPDSDKSAYLDSQAIGPGSSFDLEMVYNGSGNRNQTVGDAIFHCHFYPHFAMGMWSLWRVHDVFESGTVLDSTGRPAKGSRALPDGEIAVGTPIPALVPLPTIAMAPKPEATATIVNGQAQISGTGNPGYPFFVPGVAGHRPPHPPLDTVDDGGLPRHVITGGTFVEKHTRLDFDKTLVTADARVIPENGSAVELAAMKYHQLRTHASFTPSGTAANFITNGLPPQPGAPYADPCVTDSGAATGTPRLYKAADIQIDAKLNKAGWHFFQQRMTALWGDVAALRNGTKPPEPFFFRANSGDCITYQLANLVPNVYAQDDFEIRTPTDILGQHIHLVKFDVTSSDGSGNGWNYEDGSFSPDEVIERINAINKFGGILNGTTRTQLTPKPHPYFGTLGAQTTVQRWYADATLDNSGNDRTLRTVFTHDHFGPSTNQQIGLYAGLVVEPKGSTWRNSETGEIFGGRFDGGPTSWRADILTSATADSYREFMLEFADMQHAYTAEATTFPDPVHVINPPNKADVGLPFLLEPANPCPISGAPVPCPEAITSAEPGTMVVNYRNEPVALRVQNPATNTQASGVAGDLSFVYRSDVTRANAKLNVQPAFYPPLTGGVKAGDPFTPLLRAYEDDKVQIRILVGAHEEGHNFSVNGIKWLFEPSDPNSGFRNSQMMGISEHFEFLVPQLPKEGVGTFADYLYTPGRSVDDQWNGLWGLMRAYKGKQVDLLTLPNNPDGLAPAISNIGDFNGVCPKTAPVRDMEVTAALARDILPGGTLVYNSRTNQGGILHDPTAILFVRTRELDANGKLIPTYRTEPLVLHAAAGDCINMTLHNNLPAAAPDLAGFNTLPMIVNHFNANQVIPSSYVGLHPQLLFDDVTRSDGQNVGFNPTQTAAPGGGTATYQWYAGDLTIDSTGYATPRAIEYGATNLLSSDPIKHSNKGAFGAMIIEPKGSIWTWDADSHDSVTVTTALGDKLRDFAVLLQNDVNLRYGSDGSAVKLIKDEDDPEDSGQKGVNYRTEPMWKRMNYAPETPFEVTRTFDFTNVLSNTQVGGDPQTPVFTSTNGATLTRFRLLEPGGHQRNNVFVVHGHVWREEPYINNSAELAGRAQSEFTGAMMGVGPSSHFNILLRNGAGGAFGVYGDYLYRTFNSFQFDGGMWGILRVTP